MLKIVKKMKWKNNQAAVCFTYIKRMVHEAVLRRQRIKASSIQNKRFLVGVIRNIRFLFSVILVNIFQHHRFSFLVFKLFFVVYISVFFVLWVGTFVKSTNFLNGKKTNMNMVTSLYYSIKFLTMQARFGGFNFFFFLVKSLKRN